MRGAISASRPPGRSAKLATKRIGRSPEFAVSRPNTFYRLPLPLEYINPLQARSTRRVGPTHRTAASLAASETIGGDFFEAEKRSRAFLRAASGTYFEQIVPSGHSRPQLANRLERPHAARMVYPARRLLLSALFSRSYQREKNF